MRYAILAAEPFLDTRHYSRAEVFWYVGGFLAWVPAYTAILVIAVKQKRLEIPVLAATGNVTWEFVWGFLFHVDMGWGLQWIYRGAFIMDLPILIFVYVYGAKQTNVPLVRRWFVLINTGIVAGWVAFHVTMKNSGYDLPLGSVSAYAVNVVESAAYLWFGLTLANPRDLSMTVAWSKFIGTGMVTVFIFMVFYGNPFVRCLAVIVTVLDISYTVVLHNRIRQARLAAA
ncbi:MAG TPA: hypothetical protein VFB78_09855 [Acidimicrobiales bacterium]|nr:hypothetical protein [Acidimicrobiales bacterium]